MTDEQRREAVARAMSEREGWRLEDIGSDNKELLLMYADAAIALMRPVIRAQALEEAAKVAEGCVKQECCGNLVGGYGSPPECCGQPNVTPMYPEEIAAAIRALKEKPNG